MFKFAKYVAALGAFVLVGCATTAGKDGQVAESEATLRQAVEELEKGLPVLASLGDYRSASNVALGLASARNRLEGPSPAVCAALSQAREYQRLASMQESAKADYHVLSGIYERTGGMTRELALCDRAQALAPSTVLGRAYP
jgi:hypothetical protein